jgi:hypothetical protein
MVAMIHSSEKSTITTTKEEEQQMKEAPVPHQIRGYLSGFSQINIEVKE